MQVTDFFQSSFPSNDLEYPWSILENIDSLFPSKGKIEIEIPEGVYLENKDLISIGKGTVIEPGAFIKGPCIIGKNCEVRHGAYIRGNVIAEDNCVIGHATEIKNSIMQKGAKAAHFAYVGDCIIGQGVNLGAGVKCANFRLDKSLIKVQSNGKVINTNLRKFGAIIGDDTQIGCNTVLSPGTIIGKNSYVYPCICIGGVFPEKSRIKGK